mgnify:FL=1|jgi:hypothetical protein
MRRRFHSMTLSGTISSSVLKNSLPAHYFVVSRLKMLIYWYINSAFPLKTPRTALARDFFNTLLGYCSELS